MSAKNTKQKLHAKPNKSIEVKADFSVDEKGNMRVSLCFRNWRTGTAYATWYWTEEESLLSIPGIKNPTEDDLSSILLNLAPSKIDDRLMECFNHSSRIWLRALRSIVARARFEFFSNHQRHLEVIQYLCSKNNNYTQRPQKKRFVYLMRHSNGLIKIGFSSNPRQREVTLQAEDPMLSMIDCFPAGMDVEQRLHQIFADLRVRGEWFRLEDRHVDWILTLKPQKAKVRKRKSVAI
jgi:hypothetical protein